MPQPLRKRWWLGLDGKWRARGEAAVVATSIPVAAFTAVAKGFTATFDASASADTGSTIATYAWNFGDATTGSGKTAAHTYTRAGSFPVTLTVTDLLNSSATAAQNLTVAVGVPAAQFTWTSVYLAAQFDASTSTDTGASIAAYAWAFGDGGTGNGAKVSHTYAAAGTYTATLTVTDTTGQTATSQHTVTVATQPANVLPTASFATTVSGATVSVNGSASSDPDGSVKSWAWTWGDATTGSGATASHTYAASGTYTVGLTVTDDRGGTASVSKTVTVGSSGPVQPSGPGILLYQNLAGANMSAKLNSATTANQVSFAPGTFQWSDFALNSTGPNSGMGVFASSIAGILGSGKTATVLEMTAGSTTKSTDMTASSTGLHYFYVNTNCKLVEDLTLLGIPIGSGSQYIYNGFFLYQIAGFTMNRVLIKAIPGSGHVNPGETFGIDGYHGSNHTFTDVEIDGAGVGATGFGPNFHTGTYTLNECNAHDNPYSAGIATYQCSGTIQLNRFRSVNNHNLLNFEQNADGTIINVASPVLDGALSFDVYIGAKTGSSKVTISDPVDANGNPRTSLSIWCNPAYGSVPNSQLRSDIKVLVGGVDKTSSIVAWH